MEERLEGCDGTELISVIVPIYNVEAYLERCIDSIINQTYQNLQIILINDGSTDSCEDICKEYAKNDVRIKYVYKKNGGLSSARNLGLKLASGKYISFIDSDDYLDNYFYEVMYRTLKSEVVEMIECGVHNVTHCFNDFIFDAHNEVITIPSKQALKNMITHSGKVQPRYAVWNKIYDKKLVEGVKFPEGEIHEDYLFEAVAFMRTSKYTFISQKMYYHRVRPGSIITSTAFGEKYFDKIKHIQQRTDFFVKNGERELAKCSVRDELETLLLYYYLASKANNKNYLQYISNELRSKKREIFRCNFRVCRFVEFCIFFINANLYVKYIDLKNGLVKWLRSRTCVE